MLKSLKKSNSEGFTIIEVMIVLAIAGLILLIVFLAVPALQRNSRNTQRKNDASHIAGIISEWESNNSGSAISAAQLTSALASENMAIVTKPTSVSTATTAVSGNTAPAADSVVVYSHATCNGNTPNYSSSSRAIVVVYGLEGTTPQGCVAAD